MTPRVRRRPAERIPLMPLRSTAVYPTGVIGVQVGMPETLEMLATHPEPGLVVAVVVAPGEPEDPIDPRTLDKIAVRARVSDRLNLPGGTVQATVQGLERVRLSEVRATDGYLTALAQPVTEVQAEEGEAP